jgi:hypothetical protein
MASIIVLGSLAIAGTVWQGRSATGEIAALSGTTTSPKSSNSERNGSTISQLIKRIKALEDHVRELEEGRQIRTITGETAERLAEYLRKFGSHRVIVSCIPDDVEAYRYANQVVNVLKSADWDARGPQLTKVFGDVRAMGINIYVGGDHHSDTAKILLDGLTKFNVPFQSRVTPSQAVPDTETVELFIGAKPPEQANTSAD